MTCFVYISIPVSLVTSHPPTFQHASHPCSSGHTVRNATSRVRRLQSWEATRTSVHFDGSKLPSFVYCPGFIDVTILARSNQSIETTLNLFVTDPRHVHLALSSRTTNKVPKSTRGLHLATRRQEGGSCTGVIASFEIPSGPLSGSGISHTSLGLLALLQPHRVVISLRPVFLGASSKLQEVSA